MSLQIPNKPHLKLTVSCLPCARVCCRRFTCINCGVFTLLPVHSSSDKAPRPPQKGFYSPWGPLEKHCYIGWESESCSTTSWEGPVVSLERVIILIKERSGFWIHSVIYLCLCGTRVCSEHAVFKQGSKERSCLWHRAQGPEHLCVWPLMGMQGACGLRWPVLSTLSPAGRKHHTFLLLEDSCVLPSCTSDQLDNLSLLSLSVGFPRLAHRQASLKEVPRLKQLGKCWVSQMKEIFLMQNS